MRTMPDARERLINFESDPGRISLYNLGEWYLGPHAHRTPNKTELSEHGLELVLEGWTPPAPIIDRSTRVTGVGSCFARYFVLWLAENGFNRHLPDSPHNALARLASSF